MFRWSPQRCSLKPTGKSTRPKTITGWANLKAARSLFSSELGNSVKVCRNNRSRVLVAGNIVVFSFSATHYAHYLGKKPGQQSVGGSYTWASTKKKVELTRISADPHQRVYCFYNDRHCMQYYWVFIINYQSYKLCKELFFYLDHFG